MGSAAMASSDWHNAYARLVLDLSDRLKELPDDAARTALLERLRRAFEG